MQPVAVKKNFFYMQQSPQTAYSTIQQRAESQAYKSYYKETSAYKKINQARELHGVPPQNPYDNVLSRKSSERKKSPLEVITQLGYSTNTKGFTSRQNVPMTVLKETVMRKTSENQMRPSAYNISGSAGVFNGGASLMAGRFTQDTSA